jgi:tRNA-specific 2-thiouridylase
MRKAVVLTSGGLDSLLALTILSRQGTEPIGLHFKGWFLVPKFRDFEPLAEEVQERGFTILHRDISREYADILLHPRFGRGSGANPCVDCKLFFLKKAREVMVERGASFVATGEVLGQRPMSQQSHTLELLEKRSGLEGYLLRPLSARLLPLTIPEELGWVDREALYDIQGRSRKRQMQLAQDFGIHEYPSPAGGCLLAEPSYGRRFQDLIDHVADPSGEDLLVLKYGRHFRIGERCKLVVGKDEVENRYLEGIPWGSVTLFPISPKGPFARMTWDGRPENLQTALEVMARYCSSKQEVRTARVLVRYEDHEEEMVFSGIPDREKIEGMLIR